MGSEVVAPVVDKDNSVEETSRKRSSPGKKNQGKAPKRVRKAERERMKREQLSEHFLDLANALDLSEQNNGKASVLREATRLLKDLFSQIESMKKENASLLSETHYVITEKNEVEEENSALETQIEKLQGEIEAKIAQSRPDLNAPPHLELRLPEQTTELPGYGVQLSNVETSLQQRPAVLVVPLLPHHQAALSASNAAELIPKATSTVSKPHARYPTPADSWPSKLLGEQPPSS